MTLNGKTYVVTGAASGIGAATTTLLRAGGATVIGVDRNDCSQLCDASVLADLSTVVGVEHAVSELPDGVDGLLNIAGVPGTAPWRTVLTVNVLALRELTLSLMPTMADGAVVAHLASAAGNNWTRSIRQIQDFLGAEDWNAALDSVAADSEVTQNSYRFSKECVRWLTEEQTAKNLGRVRVVSVSPGPVLTPIFNDFKRDHGAEKVEGAVSLIGRAAEPEDIAKVLRFVLGADAGWINGSDIRVDGGLSAHREVEALTVTCR